MADFGQHRLWPKQTLAKPTLAKPSSTCVCVCLCVFVCVCLLVSWFRVGVSRFWFGHVRDRPSRDRPSDRPSLGRPSPGPPKISLFFFPLPPQNSFFSSLSGCLLVDFWLCDEDRDPQMCTFGLSGCRVKPRRLRGRRGFTRQPEISNRAHLSAPALQTPPKFHEKTPREGRKERILRRDKEKKREILGPPPFGPHPSAPMQHNWMFSPRKMTARGHRLRGKAHPRNCRTQNTWWRSVAQLPQRFFFFEEITGPHS